MADKVKFIFQFIYEYNTFFLVFFLLMNLITFALFHSDKRKAEKNSFRIPERDLLGFSACFGALGGCLGIGLGLGLSEIVTRYAEMPTVSSLTNIFGSLLISSFVGVVFGTYPAWRAAQQNPIDVLRSE